MNAAGVRPASSSHAAGRRVQALLQRPEVERPAVGARDDDLAVEHAARQAGCAFTADTISGK